MLQHELRELRLADIHIERPIDDSYIFVRAETSKSRESRKVRLDRLAAQAVHEYIKDWRPDRRNQLSLAQSREVDFDQ